MKLAREVLSHQESQLGKLVLDEIESQNQRLTGWCALGGPPSQADFGLPTQVVSTEQQQCLCHGSHLGMGNSCPNPAPHAALSPFFFLHSSSHGTSNTSMTQQDTQCWVWAFAF